MRCMKFLSVRCDVQFERGGRSCVNVDVDCSVETLETEAEWGDVKHSKSYRWWQQTDSHRRSGTSPQTSRGWMAGTKPDVLKCLYINIALLHCTIHPAACYYIRVHLLIISLGHWQDLQSTRSSGTNVRPAAAAQLIVASSLAPHVLVRVSDVVKAVRYLSSLQDHQ